MSKRLSKGESCVVCWAELPDTFTVGSLIPVGSSVPNPGYERICYCSEECYERDDQSTSYHIELYQVTMFDI